MFKLDLSSIITMFFTFSIVLLLYFYFKKRLDLTENKVDIMFNLIQEHQKQIKMQQIVNGSCNLPFAPGNSEHLNKNENNENDESAEDSDSDDNPDSGSEDEDNNDNDEQDNDEDDNNNSEEEEDDDDEEEHHNNEEIKETNLNDNGLNIDESVVIPESNLVEEMVDNIVTDEVIEPLEVVDVNENLWTEDKKSENLTILHDNNNNQIKISIVKNAESEVDYNKMKVSELKRIANERGIVGYSSLKKKELVHLLQ